MEPTSPSPIDVTLNYSLESIFVENATATLDYDYPIVTDPPIAELLSVSIVYGFTLIVGILGNGLVIFSVSRYENMMTITNTFLLSLASADLLLIIVCVPVKVGISTLCEHTHATIR